MTTTKHAPLTQEHIWENVRPRIKNQAEALVQVVFMRYKLAYKCNKKELVEQAGTVDKHPSLAVPILQAEYARLEQKENDLTATIKTDLAALRDLKEACPDQERSQFMLDEAIKTVREILSYMVYHDPTSKQIQQQIENLAISPTAISPLADSPKTSS